MEISMKSYPGFKFSPTDQELILYFLRRKIEEGQKGIEAIREINITGHEPWELPEKSLIPSNSEWYFFSCRERKYPQGRQINRATQFGYWKTGKQRNVKSGNKVVGTKRTLVFHKGQSPKWERTEWIMHEYCMSGTPRESFVVCRVRNRKNCEFNSNDIPPEELNEPLTDESSTSKNPDLADRFGSEHCKKPGNMNYQHSVESFDSESENEKKQENLLL